MFLFGICTLCQGFVQNYSGILAVRFFLGVFETGMFPGCFYLVFALHAHACCWALIVIRSECGTGEMKPRKGEVSCLVDFVMKTRSLMSSQLRDEKMTNS